jgi:hypothetical protein
MKFRYIVILVLTLFSNSALSNDGDIRKKIIAESIASYSGNCPCPYNLAQNGSKCGKRSAYSRAGGFSPICFDQDITEDMISTFKIKNNKLLN